MNTVKKSCWAGWVVCFSIGLMFAAPSLAQDAPSGFSRAELFEKDISLRIKKTRLKSKEIEKLGFEDDVEEVEIDYDGLVYNFEFRNGAEIDFDDLNVECRFFYTEESSWRVRSGEGREETEQKYEADSFEANLQAKGRYKAKSRPFVTQSYRLMSSKYFPNKPSKVVTDPNGFWVRVVHTTPDGEKLQRDFCEPESLSSRVTWGGKSL